MGKKIYKEIPITVNSGKKKTRAADDEKKPPLVSHKTVSELAPVVQKKNRAGICGDASGHNFGWLGKNTGTILISMQLEWCCLQGSTIPVGYFEQVFAQ